MCARLFIRSRTYTRSRASYTEPIGLQTGDPGSPYQRTLIGYPMPLLGYPTPYPATRRLAEAKLRSAAERGVGDPVHCPADLISQVRMADGPAGLVEGAGGGAVHGAGGAA